MTSETTSDWRANILAGMAERSQKKSKVGRAVHPGAFRRALSPVHFQTSVEFAALMRQAAQLRDVNHSSYGRRAISLLVAHDLDMPIHQVLYETPCIGRWGRIQNSPGERDLGEDIENWCPHPDCDGTHLRLT